MESGDIILLRYVNFIYFVFALSKTAQMVGKILFNSKVGQEQFLLSLHWKT